jgi:hypothetical protein
MTIYLDSLRMMRMIAIIMIVIGKKIRINLKKLMIKMSNDLQRKSKELFKCKRHMLIIYRKG